MPPCTVSESAKWPVKIPLERLFTLLKVIPRGLLVILNYFLDLQLKVTGLFIVTDNNEKRNGF